MHGGVFKRLQSRLKYVGGESRSFVVDVDELCWFTLEELAKKCGTYSVIEDIYYVEPNAKNSENGLKKVYSDDEVRTLAAIVLKYRGVDCFIVCSNSTTNMGGDVQRGSVGDAITKTRKKLSPRRKRSATEKQLGDHFNSNSGPLVVGSKPPALVASKAQIEITLQSSQPPTYLTQEETPIEASLLIKDPYQKKIEAWNAKALSIARELKKKVIEEGLSCQNKPGNQEEVVDPNGFVIDHESSGDDLQSADEADEHCIRTRKEKKKSVVVNSKTDFSKFKWSVGIRPHWPANEIVETIRVAYNVLVKVPFAYKVKYYSHTLLHGSMKGILTLVADELPKAEHRHYSRHIFAGWHRQFGGDEMKAMFQKAAKAYNQADYKEAIQEMEEVKPGAIIAFDRHNPNLFCRAFMKPTTKCDVNLSNMAETWNGYIIHARNKQLIDMLEDIRASLMQRTVLKRNAVEKRIGKIYPRVTEQLEKEKTEAAYCCVLPSNIHQFQVNHSCIFLMHQNAEDWVEDWYTKETYVKIYSGSISPWQGERHRPIVDDPLDPPPIRIGPGMPRKNKRKHPMEDPKKKGKLTKHGIKMTCSVCNSENHNKRKCLDKDKIQASEPASKRGRGRPRKDAQTGEVLEVVVAEVVEEVVEGVVEAKLEDAYWKWSFIQC
ncbi:Proline--tRNA ligase [Bienertia sinuspersici]